MEENVVVENKKPDFKKKDGNRKPRFERKPRENQDEFTQKNLGIRRVTAVTAGGRTMRFSATVVVGDKKGRVGLGIAKAAEVPVAIEKAAKLARKNVITVPVVNGTIPHEVKGKFSTTTVLMSPTKEGNGIIAGGSARAIMELAGYKNVTTKIHGSTNKINAARATLNGLKELRTREEVAALRGKKVEEI